MQKEGTSYQTLSQQEREVSGCILCHQSFEDEDKVNVVEDNTKEIASEWLVDSGASVHVSH